MRNQDSWDAEFCVIKLHCALAQNCRYIWFYAEKYTDEYVTHFSAQNCKARNVVL